MPTGDPTIDKMDETLANGRAQLLKIPAIANMTADQITQYIDTNVTDLASAKTVLKMMARILFILLSRDEKIR